MRLPTPLGLAVLAASAASAFIIPSTISLPDLEISDVERIGSMRAIEPSGDGSYNFLVHPKETQFADRAIGVYFDISEDCKTLKFNDAPIYPVTAAIGPITAALVGPAEFEASWAALPQHDVSFLLSAHVNEAADGSVAEIVDIDLWIQALGKVPVSVGNVAVRLLKDEEGVLNVNYVLAFDAEENNISYDEEVEEDDDDDDDETFEDVTSPFYATTPRPDSFHHHEHHGHHGHSPRPAFVEQDCGEGVTIASTVCKVRNFFGSKISGLAGPRRHGCSRRPGMISPDGMHGPPGPPIHGGPAKFWHADEDSEDRPTFDGYHHHHEHHEDEEHHSFHDFLHHHHHPSSPIVNALRFIVLGILIPVVIGVAAGMAASLLGMLVGTAVAWAWIRFVRKGRRGNASAATQCGGAEEKAVQVPSFGGDEKAVFLVSEKEEEAAVELEANAEMEGFREPPPGYVEKE